MYPNISMDIDTLKQVAVPDTVLCIGIYQKSDSSDVVQWLPQISQIKWLHSNPNGILKCSSFCSCFRVIQVFYVKDLKFSAFSNNDT